MDRPDPEQVLAETGGRVSGWQDGKRPRFRHFYSRAVAPYWDLQLGWRHDIRPEPSRDWLAIGFEGLAPYWFEIDAAAFIGESGQLGVRLEGEYEGCSPSAGCCHRKWNSICTPGTTNGLAPVLGLSDLELGLRLRYEIRREFAPYIGVNWTRKFGNTADFARAEGEDTNDVQIVAGVRVWF